MFKFLNNLLVNNNHHSKLKNPYVNPYKYEVMDFLRRLSKYLPAQYDLAESNRDFSPNQFNISLSPCGVAAFFAVGEGCLIRNN